MKILFSTLDSAQNGFDCAERKGFGHPDTLADLIADTFSREYSRWCLQEFGIIPNHWVDKVTLVGAASHVTFGSFAIAKPVQCHLIGKITEQIGDRPIPLMELFEQATLHVMTQALGGTAIWPHMRLYISSTSGTAVDHDAGFYAPGRPEDLRKVLQSETVANDSVICTGSSGPGPAGRLAIWLEEHIRRIAPAQIGTDVKTLVVCEGDRYDVTAAVPVHPEAVQSWREYADLIDVFRGRLESDLAARCDAELHLNTKDRAERGYLAPFGTALGKGDCGVVGRGNRAYGVIEPLRPAGCEAPAGKNPLHHGGKIYSTLACRAAQALEAKSGSPAEVTIVARNGEPLEEPAFLHLALCAGADRAAAEEIVRETLAGAREFVSDFLAVDPVDRFRMAAL